MLVNNNINYTAMEIQPSMQGDYANPLWIGVYSGLSNDNIWMLSDYRDRRGGNMVMSIDDPM